MKLLPVLAIGLTMAACSPVHTAVAPVADPDGRPIVIEVPGIAAGAKPKESQILAVRETLVDHVDARTMKSRYLPGFDEKKDAATLGTVGAVGSLTTKKGHDFVGIIPIAVVATNRPAGEAEQAASRLAIDVYKVAKQKYRIYSQDDLQKKR